jgi:hypothetical protein
MLFFILTLLSTFLHAFILPPMRATCLVHHIHIDLVILIRLYKKNGTNRQSKHVQEKFISKTYVYVTG